MSLHAIPTMPTFFRSPLLHFMILGTLLFATQAWRAARPTAERGESFRIALETDRLVELRRSFVEQTGRGPDSAEMARMIEAEVAEEILYREAIARGLLERDGGVQTRLLQKMLFLEGGTQIEDAGALLARAVELGLHREDVVVRRILVQKMKLLGSQLDPEQRVRVDEIAEVYREERETFRSPDRLTLAHVFLSRDRRGPTLERDARALRRRLIEHETPVSEAIALGDPFPLGHHLDRRSRDDLARSFGARFGEAAFALESEGWSTPIESAYGLHLVRVEARERGRIPPLEAVTDRIRLQLEEQRRAANLEALQTHLRTRYEVVLPDDGPGRRGLLESRAHSRPALRRQARLPTSRAATRSERRVVPPITITQEPG